MPVVAILRNLANVRRFGLAAMATEKQTREGVCWLVPHGTMPLCHASRWVLITHIVPLPHATGRGTILSLCHMQRGVGIYHQNFI
jgi:hypothetical protein